MIASSPLVSSIPDKRFAQLEWLLRQILEQRDAPAARLVDLPPAEINVAEIMLDLEIDGVPYRLIRVRSQEPPLNAKCSISLSPREREIVRLVAKGLPNKSIADVLDISLWTVATHLRRVFAKLGVGTRAEMVARVIGDGLLDGSAGETEE